MTKKNCNGYIFDDDYLQNIISRGNRNLNIKEFNAWRTIYPEQRLNYLLFALKHPELPYGLEGFDFLETVNRYFDEETYAFRVTEKPVQYPTYDFSRIKAPQLYRRPTATGFLIGTSLAPTRLEVQQEAVETWLCQGFDVLSVNYPDEIEKLRPLFPEVRFVPNIKNSLDRHSRKLIYLDDVFQALQAQSGSYEGFGLINSDITLFELNLEKLKHACREAVVYSHRIELPERHTFAGLDAFFLNGKALAYCCNYSSNFMLGAPFWDYYLPTMLLAGDFKLIRAIPPLCGHITHPLNRSKAEWDKFAEEYYPFFTENIQKLPIYDKGKLANLLNDQVPKKLIARLIIYIYHTLPDYLNLVQLGSLDESGVDTSTIPDANSVLKPAFILGNGPSLKGFDFQNKLRGYATFGMNAAYRFWDRNNWYPTYYSCLDTVLGLSHKDEIRRLIERADEYGFRGFLLRANLIHKLGKTGGNSKVTCFEDLKLSSPFLNSPQITTGSHTLGWAAALGFQDIVLLGIDAAYVEIINEARKVKGIILELAKTPDTNPNYFFDDYQREGDRYNIPNPNTAPDKAIHLCSWRELKTSLSQYKVCVVNANPDSKVDAFPKCRFEDVEATIKQERAIMLSMSTRPTLSMSMPMTLPKAKLPAPLVTLTQLSSPRSLVERILKKFQPDLYLAIQLLRTGAFDVQFYLATYPDVARSGKDPALHYVRYGWKERRNPAPWFNTARYLADHPDVAKSGMNPLLHYIKYGRAERRVVRPANFVS